MSDTNPIIPAAVEPDPLEYQDPVVEFYKKDVDRTLLRENLKLTVDERFRRFENFMEYLSELRAAGRRFRKEA